MQLLSNEKMSIWHRPHSVYHTRLPPHSFNSSGPMVVGSDRCEGLISILRLCSNCIIRRPRRWHFIPEDRVVRCLHPDCTAWLHEHCYNGLQKSGWPGMICQCQSDGHVYSFSNWNDEVPTNPVRGRAWLNKELLDFWDSLFIFPFVDTHFRERMIGGIYP
ncbi:hypothetical protein BJ508DRAFT_102149 [Ascobolus immersus RN42]|uniref:Uncharacterized protein n=1 Tax=Ascobolus immersus RN42 TaxID=1160509 RepID=A0A3N4I753_ASCIM|nr:hypothetical protein BJ508DRAFT_102149 [Ascobolus immersus RN42]